MAIIAAAIKFGDVVCFVPAPGRHHNVLHKLVHAYGKRSVYEKEIQGFLTDTGGFLNRREAFAHAKACGQPMRTRHPTDYNGDELYSEDLW